MIIPCRIDTETGIFYNYRSTSALFDVLPRNIAPDANARI